MHKDNNFGFLRLLFSYLVIVAHADILPNADSQFKIFYPLIYPFANGSLAVEGFFLISGYLIYKSFMQSSSAFSYFRKRVLRIYPGFIVASLFCIFLVAPISGGWVLLSQLTILDWARNVFNMFALLQVSVKGVFPNMPNLPLNSPMWTIKFEFICYLIVPFLVLFLKNRNQLLLLFLGVAGLHILSIHFNLLNSMPFIYKFSQLFSAFLVGSLFYVFRDKVIWSQRYSLASILLLIPILYMPYIANLGLMILGGYLLFNFAFNYHNTSLANIGKNTDISYGVYLYAWPISALVTQFIVGGRWLHLGLTLAIASILGYLSWRIIEKPFMQMKHKLQTAQ